MAAFAEIVNSRGKVLHREDITDRGHPPDRLDVRVGDAVWQADLLEDLPRISSDGTPSDSGTAVYTYVLVATVAT